MTGEVTAARAASNKSAKFSFKSLLFVAIPAIVVVLGVFGLLYSQAQRETPPPVDFLAIVKLALRSPKRLSQSLTDKNGDLVADAPEDPALWLDPETLEFEILGRDLASETQQWSDFVSHLQQVTGKQVHLTLRPEPTSLSSSEATPPTLQQARDFHAGKIHLACLNTGAVTLNVNEGGAVPFCVMADEAGKFGYEMEIIVPADSRVTKVSQLKGAEKVFFASMYSHSGFKAPLMILWNDFNLQPERDYTPVFVSGQEQAIEVIAKNRGDAAPVASDLLRRIIGRGDVAEKSIRSIYKSKAYPPACFAYAHQLKPELAEKVKTAFLEFRWAGTSLEKAYAAAQQSRFVPASYQNDWQSVRDIEDQVSSLLQSEDRHP
ncbi:PhnD/SsuA/transferrin family substrate-binding protein [Anatilimnocola floriformis]|uniref:PhnD/SsuA/transferrin family substrate-binding protein n=1 Tax=Anatilimnocola floriformis TaxID=2948575 RepID=UPI0020C489A6|nr:PhnD/SsuA/transferrin family substrate-binding protein [Anatilimnocola floriformis]